MIRISSKGELFIMKEKNKRKEIIIIGVLILLMIVIIVGTSYAALGMEE